jgi:hypothetical protein
VALASDRPLEVIAQSVWLATRCDVPTRDWLDSRLLLIRRLPAAPSAAHGGRSFAERLIELGAPCVVSWGRRINDSYASALAALLYDQLANGVDVEVAVAFARAFALQKEAELGTSEH